MTHEVQKGEEICPRVHRQGSDSNQDLLTLEPHSIHYVTLNQIKSKLVRAVDSAKGNSVPLKGYRNVQKLGLWLLLFWSSECHNDWPPRPLILAVLQTDLSRKNRPTNFLMRNTGSENSLFVPRLFPKHLSHTAYEASY